MITDITDAIIKTLDEKQADILAYSFVDDFNLENEHTTFSKTETTMYLSDLQDLLKDVEFCCLLNDFVKKIQQYYETD